MTGKILLEGQPVPVGSIAFVPAEGVDGPSGGTRIENGVFNVPASQNLSTGEFHVEVIVIPQRPEGYVAPSQSSPTTVNQKPDEWALKNPVKIYKDPDQKTVLKAGANEYEVDLKLK